jgi:hypothetical protein
LAKWEIVIFYFLLYRHGRGKYYLPDGTMKIGIWDDGKRIRWIENNDSETTFALN